MPAKSEKQRRLFAIALHSPDKLHKSNRHILKMSQEELREMASTSNKSNSNKLSKKDSTRHKKLVEAMKRRSAGSY